VLDAANGLLLVAERAAKQRKPVGAWNIGPPPGPPVDVGVLAQMTADAWQDGAKVVIDRQDRFPETHFLAVDSTRARTDLAAQSPWDIKRVVAETVAWYRQALAGKDVWQMTQAQIAVYSADRAKGRAAKAAG
jgi:CDP-glucose 4,6-dehydratase